MKNFPRRLILVLLIVLVILISGCNKKKDTSKTAADFRVGTDGILVSFLGNNPPAIVHVEEGGENTFRVSLEIRNKGAFPQPEEGAGTQDEFGKLYLSGYDKKIITLKKSGGSDEHFPLSKGTLEGKSTINPSGGIDFADFDGTIPNIGNLKVEKYDLTLLATACYQYSTVIGPSVCIDPDPYSTISERKVCTIKPLTFSNQGAPIAVTRIDEEALASKTQFRITIKNVGKGDVLKTEAYDSDKCNPYSEAKLTREDIDKVRVEGVEVTGYKLQCGPFAEGNVKNTEGYVRLINGEGSIICEFPKTNYQQSRTAFTTPLKVNLKYYYRNTAERKLLIKKEGTISSDSSSTSGGTEPVTLPPASDIPQSTDDTFFT